MPLYCWINLNPSLVQYRSLGLNKTAFSRLILGLPIALLLLLAAGIGRYDLLLSNALNFTLSLAPSCYLLRQHSFHVLVRFGHIIALFAICNSIPHWFATSDQGAPCCASKFQFSPLLAPEKGGLRGQYWRKKIALQCGMKLNQVNTPLHFPARRSRAVNRSSLTKSHHPFCSALGPKDVWISRLLKETKETWGAHLVLKATTHTRISYNRHTSNVIL